MKSIVDARHRIRRIGSAGLVTGAVVVLGAAWMAPSQAFAGTSAPNFAVVGQASVLQITEDFPTATSHPQVEAEYGYTATTLSTSGGSALADLLWPGAIAGNAGTLIEVLTGSSSLTALNDPVRAQAGTGTSETHQSTTTPSGTEMTASVDPPNPGDQFASAKAATAAGGMGAVGTVGNSRSSSTIYFDSATNILTASSSVSGSDLSIDGGIIKIGSVKSSAQGVSNAGAQPQMTGSLVVGDFSVAGQQAYVDGAGVHVGSPGNPAGPAQQAAVNAALAQSGMQVYFTTPHVTPIGSVTYYYAASMLFYWHPPNNSHGDTFTASVGGAAVSMGISPGFSWSPPPVSSVSQGFTPRPPVTSGGTSLAATPVQGSTTPRSYTSLALPTPAGNTGSSPDLSPVQSAPGGTANPSLQQNSTAAAVNLPAGLSGWWLLILLGAIGGAALLPRVPALLDTTSAARCPHGTPKLSQRRIQR